MLAVMVEANKKSKRESNKESNKPGKELLLIVGRVVVV
jgi:hypothetical protein